MNSLTHIAIIMDGNGRWANDKGLKRKKGHEKGAKVVEDITKACIARKIDYLTLYAFSTENWKRPEEEINFLMKLLAQYLKKQLKTYMKHGIRLRVIGDLSRFSHTLQQQITTCITKTENNTAFTQIIALNYGSQDEIIRAIKKMTEKDIEALSIDSFPQFLDTAGIPDVDLLIRTSGEQRISNFLLWQIAYAELYFTPVLWPDFTEAHLDEAIENFNNRNRRFGGTK